MITFEGMGSEPEKEMRDIKFPKAPKKEPILSPIRSGGQDIATRKSGGKGVALLVIFLLLAAGAIGMARLNGSQPVGDKASVDVFEKLTDRLKNGVSAYNGLKEISLGALGLTGFIDGLQVQIPDILAGRIAFSEPLKEARDRLSELIQAFDTIASSDGYFRDKIPFLSEYVAWRGSLTAGRDLMSAVVRIVESEGPHHFLIIFGNTSELRPGGGFIGSFADIEVVGGKIQEISVHDINEVDRTRDELVIPPKPIQAIAGKWKAADANWFFDYPSSAGKFLEFVRQSDLYENVQIDGVIAITPAVIEDILQFTGPIETASGQRIDAADFINVIQEEVQAGQAENAEHPKLVLAELAPVLNSAIIKLSKEDQLKLIGKVKGWISEKDVMIYSPDKELAKALLDLRADGSSYKLTGDFLGDYLAVASANIGGGKTDLYMEQKIFLDSHLTESGVVRNDLKIERKHKGNERKEWWYRETNWSYLKVFTPKGALPQSMAGFGLRNIQPKADYSKGYSKDPAIEAEEKSLMNSDDGKLQVFAESDKNVFGTWQKIAPGTSKVLEISYYRSTGKIPQEGEEFVFVYESQAGANTSFEAIFTAPPGYVWAENDMPVYEFRASDPPGRIVLGLGLKRH